MDDGLVLRADVFRPDDGGRYPAILITALRQGLAFQEGYKTAWEIMARENRCARRVVEQVPELGSGRPEKWVPRAMRSCASIRAAPGARRLPVPQQCARDARPPPLHRMGGGAELVQRQDRHERHLVLREQPVARGGDAARTRRDLRLGGLNDAYRDGNRHGGIICTFRKHWQDMQ